MTSIDEASGAVGGNAEQARELAGGIASTKQTLEELTARTAALGMESKAEQARAAGERAGELSDNANALAEALDALRVQVDALRGLLASGTGSGTGSSAQPLSSAPQPTTSTNRSKGVPGSWTEREADNGKGTVYQDPNASGNANMLRKMDPTGRYPNGYVRFYNEHGQPIGLDGKPGPRSKTHIPVNDDGTYDVPEGWNG